MQRSELLARVRQQTLISTAELADSAINALLLEGLYDVCARYPRWPFLYKTAQITFTQGTSTYALPTDLLSLEDLVYDGAGPARLVRTSIQAVKRIYGNTPGVSVMPDAWYQEGNNIVFVPTPDSSTQKVNVHYYGLPASTTFDQDNESPPFNIAFHPMLADYVSALIWEREEMEERAQFYWVRYFDYINRMAKFYAVQLTNESIILGGGYGRYRNVPTRDWLGV